MIRLIGVYDYTVILTYISLLSSLLGMTNAIRGDFRGAVLCLAFSGLCDAFDGRIARTKKNRTDDEKNFGIQLDSLCDVICFGVLPALICYLLGLDGVLGMCIVCLYCICAVIRLAFFNVLEGKRQQTEGGSNKIYRGLPVTSISVILPVVYFLRPLMPEAVFTAALALTLAVVGFLFVLDFRLRKPGLKTVLLLIATAAAAIGLLSLLGR